MKQTVVHRQCWQEENAGAILTSAEGAYPRDELEDLHVALDEDDDDSEDEGGNDQKNAYHLECLGRLPPACRHEHTHVNTGTTLIYMRRLLSHCRKN